MKTVEYECGITGRMIPIWVSEDGAKALKKALSELKFDSDIVEAEPEPPKAKR